jgi:hypothetical protein
MYIMPSREHLLTDPSQLNALSVLPFTRTSGLGRLRLGGNIAEHPEKKRWESELNKYYYACGCNTSGIGLIIALLVGSAWAAYSYFQGSWGGGFAVEMTLLIAVGGAIIGKLIGWIRANEELRKTVREIQQHWKPEQPQGREQWSCG